MIGTEVAVCEDYNAPEEDYPRRRHECRRFGRIPTEGMEREELANERVLVNRGILDGVVIRGNPTDELIGIMSVHKKAIRSSDVNIENRRAMNKLFVAI